MLKEKLDVTILKKFNLPFNEEPELKAWRQFVTKLKNPKNKVKVGLIGKYIELPDAYKSIVEAVIHAGATNECKVDLKTIHSEEITESSLNEMLNDLNGIIVAPGFGHRGIEGKILAVKFARENGIPFLGICLGMQCAVIEFARNVLGLTDANSTEMVRTTSNPVIDLMEDQKGITDKGGTMRLGAYPCNLKVNSKAYKAYGNQTETTERHRHRYEFNNSYIEQFEQKGMEATGINPDTGLVEIMEIPKHPWFVGVQFHPEYKSTVVNPHPLFVDFIRSSIELKK
jgi:CTP synthase